MLGRRTSYPGDASGRTAQSTTSRRRWFQLGLAFFVIGVVAIPVSWSIEGDAWWVHGVWCAIGIALTLPAMSRALRLGFEVVLTDHLVMFVGAFMLYFLFGALLLAVGPEDQIQRALAFYSIDARDAMRVNAVNGIGFGLALMTAALCHGRWLARQADQFAAAATRVTTDVAALLFLILGTAASFNVLTVDLGLREGIAAGVWRTAAKLSLVAIFLASAHRGRGEKGLRLTAVLVALVEAAGGLLLFDKTATLLPLAALVAGISVRYRRRAILPLGTVLLAAVFVSTGGPVLFGRNTLVGNRESVVAERWRLVKEGVSLARDGSVLTAYDPWARLCYTPAQTAALNLYDAGRGGNEIRLIPWLFVPRALAPNKPIISRTGEDLHTKITGQRGTNTGQGIFVGGYYSAGWPGVMLVSILCGWILSQTSAIAQAVLNRRAMLLAPLALLGVFIAFRVDGDFLVDYFGAFVFILYLLVPAAFLIKVWRRASP
jgi:hypothetical protein